MLKGIDISNRQSDLRIANVWEEVDFVICKATEGTWFVDNYCDPWVQTCIQGGKPWGFYHYAGSGNPVDEAEFFVANCENYFGKGIPVLDWEGVYENGELVFDQDVRWVNEFVATVHDLTGVWCWIYANPWRFNQGGVAPTCMRWVASYPEVPHPTFEQAQEWEPPAAEGLVGCWQFCSDGLLDGYYGNLDCDLFYGDEEAWRAYAGACDSGSDSVQSGDAVRSDDDVHPSVFEDERVRVTVEVKR